MDARDAELHIGQQLGNYEILEILGMGGMGIVFRGRHVILDKPVAIKVIRRRYEEFAGNKDQLLREARTSTRVRHPNIVDVTDFGTSPDGEVFFVMEYLEGRSLFDRIVKEGAVPLLGAVNIVRQIASALSLAHEMGVIHRDLKPENVFLIRQQGRRRVVRRMVDASGAHFEVEGEGEYDLVKLLDFGLAKVLREQSVTSTQPGMIIGTPAYLAPEQIKDASVDARTDIYSLGILFYEMITGIPPFSGSNAELLIAQVSREHKPPGEMNPEVELDDNTTRTIMKCMKKDPRERFKSMDELDEALSGCFVDQVYLREAEHMPGAVDAGLAPPEPPSRRGQARGHTITEELQDLLHGSSQDLERKLEQALAGPAPELLVQRKGAAPEDDYEDTKETQPWKTVSGKQRL